MPVRDVFDAVDTTGQDAVVHACFASDSTQQWRVGRIALERQAYDTARHVGEVVALLAFVNLFGFLNETLGGRMLWVQEHIGDRTLLDDHASVHHCNLVTHAADHIHFMGDQHDGQVQFAVDLGQQLQD